MKQLEFKPPEFPSLKRRHGIFLGGSIEMGTAINWQKIFVDEFRDGFILNRQWLKPDQEPTYSYDMERYVILNPRRDNWDSSLEQSIKNPTFFQQVTWELSYLEQAEHRVFYFAQDTISPISLLELGKFHKAKHGYTYIYWDPEYKRAGNLEVFCNRYGLEVFTNFNDIISLIKLRSNDGRRGT